jgi:hypothetical protein
MPINVKWSECLVEQAKVFGIVEHRSVPKQIQYGSQTRKVAQKNPDLTFSLLREILIADQEPVIGEYVFSSCVDSIRSLLQRPLKNCMLHKN